MSSERLEFKVDFSNELNMTNKFYLTHKTFNKYEFTFKWIKNSYFIFWLFMIKHIEIHICRYL